MLADIDIAKEKFWSSWVVTNAFDRRCQIVKNLMAYYNTPEKMERVSPYWDYLILLNWMANVQNN